MDKETRRLLKALVDQGATIVNGRSGHLKVYRGAAFIGAISKTPGDHRTRKNEATRLRRGGFKV